MVASIRNHSNFEKLMSFSEHIDYREFIWALLKAETTGGTP